MNTRLNKSIVGTLALTAIFAVSSNASYAQKGKSFGGMLQNKSFSSNGGNKGTGLNLQSNNSQPGGGIGTQFQNKSFQNKGLQNSGLQNNGPRNIISGNQQNNGLGQNNLLGISRDNLKQGGNQNFGRGGLQQILGNGKGGLQTSPGNAGNQEPTKHGLQNWLKNSQIGGQNQNSQQGNGGLRHNGGNAGKLLNIIKSNQQQGKICVDHHNWCNTQPKKCHWWYDWCHSIRYCEPVHYHHCSWDYVHCDYLVGGRVIIADARWYLGMKGLLLPGQGIGIEEIAPGSPAAVVGLQPGMVITRCNGIDLVDEAALGMVIEQSGGVLQMDLRLSADGPPATCVVVMQRVASISY